MTIDTHCHIDLYQNPKKVLSEAANSDSVVLSMTNLPSHFELGYLHFVTLKNIRLALGMHPLMAEFHKKEFPLFLRNLHKTSYIGEVGLDYSKEGIATKHIQFETFNKILNSISGQNKILSIHSRKAEKEVLDLLIKYKIKNAIFHWYSGKIELIEEIVKNGFYFSINPAMIISQNGQKIVRKIPKEYILTETDGPFVKKDGVILNPGQVQSVIKFLSAEWGVPREEASNIIKKNLNVLIRNLKQKG